MICTTLEMDMVVLALTTKLEHVEKFEQAITGGFSSILDWHSTPKFYYQIYIKLMKIQTIIHEIKIMIIK